MKNMNHRKQYVVLKRGLDIIFSALLLFFLWLPMLCIAILIHFTSAGPVIFRQNRVGRNGKIFTCYKFRTMYRDAPSNRPTATFTEAERFITPVGRFLRRSSLDELPQFWNVLRGDMSIVGPRPLIPNEKEIHELRDRCGVYRLRPGLTGLAQISGRDDLNEREKARLDSRYVHRFGFAEDMAIVLQTLGKIWTGAGVAQKRKISKGH